MRINSKGKGNRAERELAMFLSYITGIKWFRVPCSGSLFTNTQQSEYRGDVYSNNDDYKDIVIECKHYKTPVRILDLFNDKSNFNCWVRQLEDESKNLDGYLFFKNNGKWFWLSNNDTNSQFLNLLNKHSLIRCGFGMLDLNPAKVRKSKRYIELFKVANEN